MLLLGHRHIQEVEGETYGIKTRCADTDGIPCDAFVHRTFDVIAQQRIQIVREPDKARQYDQRRPHPRSASNHPHVSASSLAGVARRGADSQRENHRTLGDGGRTLVGPPPTSPTSHPSARAKARTRDNARWGTSPAFLLRTAIPMPGDRPTSSKRTKTREGQLPRSGGRRHASFNCGAWRDCFGREGLTDAPSQVCE